MPDQPNNSLYLSIDIDPDTGDLRARQVDMTCAIQCDREGRSPHQYSNRLALLCASDTDAVVLRAFCERLMLKLDNFGL